MSTQYLVWSGSVDVLSEAPARKTNTIMGAYDAAYDISQSWDGYVLVMREHDNDARSRSTVVMFKHGVKLWEEDR